MNRSPPSRSSAMARGLLFGMLVTVTACSTPGQFGATGSECGSPSECRGSPNEITEEEIATIPESDAFEIVRVLRPRWLRPRNAGTISSLRGAQSGFMGVSGSGTIYPEVFQNDLAYGPIESLRDFGVVEIERMEFIDALDATTLYGIGYMAGIIRVVTRR